MKTAMRGRRRSTKLAVVSEYGRADTGDGLLNVSSGQCGDALSSRFTLTSRRDWAPTRLTSCLPGNGEARVLADCNSSPPSVEPTRGILMDSTGANTPEAMFPIQPAQCPGICHAMTAVANSRHTVRSEKSFRRQCLERKHPRLTLRCGSSRRQFQSPTHCGIVGHS